jgi:flagellar biosynthesis protein FlhG
MSDQAAELRNARGTRERACEPAPAGPPVLVLGSGKGGVGKSALAVLLAATFARRGRRTLLVDSTQNQGNLHVLLGVRPAIERESLLAGEVRAEDLVVPIAPGLELVPSDSGAVSTYRLARLDRARVQERVSTLYPHYECVVVEGGPGVEGVVCATLAASCLGVVTVPEPAAISDAYALIKIVHLQMPALPVSLIVNRTSTPGEAEAVHERLTLATQTFLHRSLSLLGELPEDDRMREAVRRPGGLLELADGPIFAGVERLAGAWLEHLARLAADAPSTPGSATCPA